MAVQENKWRSDNGKLYDTETDAKKADLVFEVTAVIDDAGYGKGNYEFDSEAAVLALLNAYELTPRET